MSTQRFTPEFKEEAVKQVTEHGYSVAEVSARLGVSSHSLYKWVKAVTPDNSEKQAPMLACIHICINRMGSLMLNSCSILGNQPGKSISGCAHAKKVAAKQVSKLDIFLYK